MRAALRALAELSFVQIDCVSSFYETPPWGKIDQPPFLNAAACVSFAGAPHSLLGEMQRIERELGRVRCEHWGARTIDLDLLHVDGVTTSDDVLTLPHPYLTERAFVLVPLAEIAPDLTVRGRAVFAWLQHADASGIVRAPELSVPYPLNLIAACDAAGGIGRGGQLLVRCPEDMAYFRRQTMGGIVVMGRRTMESLPEQDGRILFCRERLNGQTDFMLCRRFRNYGRCSGASHLTNLVRSLSSAARNAIASFCHMSGVLM